GARARPPPPRGGGAAPRRQKGAARRGAGPRKANPNWRKAEPAWPLSGLGGGLPPPAMPSIARQVAAKASCRTPSFDFVCRRKSREPAQPNGAKKPVARRVAAGAGPTRQAGRRAAAGEKVGDGSAVRAKHTTVIVDHEAALRVEQTRHHATDVKSPPQRGECEVATAECTGLFATRGLVVAFDRGRDGIRVEPMEPGEIRRG